MKIQTFLVKFIMILCLVDMLLSISLHSHRIRRKLRRKATLDFNGKKFTVNANLSSGSFGQAILVTQVGHRTQYVIKKIQFEKRGDDEMFANEVNMNKEIKLKIKPKYSSKEFYQNYGVFRGEDGVQKIDNSCGSFGMLFQTYYKEQITFKSLSKTSYKIRLDYVIKLSKLLKELHSNSIGHLDIKLENVMINDYNSLALIDFGLSEVIHDNEFNYSMRGSFPYMDPNMQVNNECSLKSDVYSYGVILHEILTAGKKFQTELSKKVKDNIHNRKKKEDYYTFTGRVLKSTNTFYKNRYSELPIEFKHVMKERDFLTMFAFNPKNRPTMENIYEFMKLLGTEEQQLQKEKEEQQQLQKEKEEQQQLLKEQEKQQQIHQMKKQLEVNQKKQTKQDFPENDPTYQNNLKNENNNNGFHHLHFKLGENGDLVYKFRPNHTILSCAS